jgi:hypothetical protein
MLYSDDNVKVTMITINGKKELAIDYYRSGYFLGRIVTEDFKDINKITVKLATK